MRTKILSLILFYTLILLSSCQRDISEIKISKIYPKYCVSVVEEDSIKTVVSAEFFKKNLNSFTVFILDSGAVFFDGIELSNDTTYFGYFPLAFRIISSKYTSDFTSIIKNGVFEFEDTQGTIYTNSIPDINSIQYDTTTLQLPKGDSIKLTWEGLPIQVGEEVYITGKHFEENNQQKEGATSIYLKLRNNINLDSFDIPQNPFDTYLTRRQMSFTSDNPNGEEEGGEIVTTYKSLPFPVEIVE